METGYNGYVRTRFTTNSICITLFVYLFATMIAAIPHFHALTPGQSAVVYSTFTSQHQLQYMLARWHGEQGGCQLCLLANGWCFSLAISALLLLVAYAATTRIRLPRLPRNAAAGMHLSTRAPPCCA